MRAVAIKTTERQPRRKGEAHAAARRASATTGGARRSLHSNRRRGSITQFRSRRTLAENIAILPLSVEACELSMDDNQKVAKGMRTSEHNAGGQVIVLQHQILHTGAANRASDAAKRGVTRRQEARGAETTKI
jgi:hypothetical protein